MAPGAGVAAQIDQLIDLFNRRSLDLPDGLFTRNTQFLLNGVPFEELLGRSPSDPLVLMLARGPAGYRFAVKAVQHAVVEARLQRGELIKQARNGVDVVMTQCRLSGRLRGAPETVQLLIDVTLSVRGTTADQIAVTVDPEVLDQLREARLRN